MTLHLFACVLTCVLLWKYALPRLCLIVSQQESASTAASVWVQGHCYRSRTGKLERYFKPDWLMSNQIPTQPADLPAIKVAYTLNCVCV